ncbi:MAG: hypothetical protein WBA12_08950 [Catalinimonas sp.]
MNRLLLLCSFLLLAGALRAQDDDYYNPRVRVEPSVPKPRIDAPAPVYLGGGTGFDSPVGIIGGLVDVAVAEKISVGAGLGIGGWGLKATGQARYYFNAYPKGLAANVGFSYVSGISEIEITTTNMSDPIRVRFEPLTTINLSGIYFLRVGKLWRMGFEVGYSVPLKFDAYENLDYPARVLDRPAQQFLEVWQPGGIIVGLSLYLAIRP